jgi:hypothetical protein
VTELAELAAEDPSFAMQIAHCLRQDLRSVAERRPASTTPPPAPAEGKAREPTPECVSVQEGVSGEQRVREARKLLTGWRAICPALGENYANRKKIGSLNDRLVGPIINRGKGTQPMVYQDALLEWWNKLAIQAQEFENRREGTRLAVEAQHEYGRAGTVAPEIGGGVKKRRRDKQT